MPSQTDLDQGGTTRQWERVYLGPSVGWVYIPVKNFLASAGNSTTINAQGTYTLDPSTTFVQINVNGPVTIILPPAVIPSNAMTLPGRFVRSNVTIVDVGGFASIANPIIIQPTSVAETVMGLTQIRITSSYGGFILQPVSNRSTWVNAQ